MLTEVREPMGVVSRTTGAPTGAGGAGFLGSTPRVLSLGLEKWGDAPGGGTADAGRDTWSEVGREG